MKKNLSNLSFGSCFCDQKYGNFDNGSWHFHLLEYLPFQKYGLQREGNIQSFTSLMLSARAADKLIVPWEVPPAPPHSGDIPAKLHWLISEPRRSSLSKSNKSRAALMYLCEDYDVTWPHSSAICTIKLGSACRQKSTVTFWSKAYFFASTAGNSPIYM